MLAEFHALGVWISLWKEKDFLSPCVRKSLYSSRVPHQWWKGLFRKKRTSFHQVWWSPSILTESLTPGPEGLFLNKRTFFTRCEKILLFWQSSLTPVVGRSLQKEKDFLSPGVRKILLFWQSSPTPSVERSLYKQKDFLSPSVMKPFYFGRVPTHHVYGFPFLQKRILFYMVWRGLSISAMFTLIILDKFRHIKRPHFSYVQAHLLSCPWMSYTTLLKSGIL